MERLNSTMETLDTLPSLFDFATSTYASLPMMKSRHPWGYQSISYNELGRLISYLASGLISRGLERGTKVALISENSPEWAIVYCAVTATGGIIVPLDPLLNENEIRHLLMHSETRMLISSPKIYSDKIEAMNLGNVELFVTGEKEVGSKCSSLGELMAKGKEMVSGGDETFYRMKQEVKPDDTAAICYTSGTTGQPKGVVLTHRNLVSNVKSCVERVIVSSDDIFLCLLPLHHTFATTCNLLVPMARGASIVFARSMKSRDIIADIETERVSVLIGVPLLYENIAAAFRKKLQAFPGQKKLLVSIAKGVTSFFNRVFKRNLSRKVFESQLRASGLGSLRLCISGAAALRADVEKDLFALGLPVLQGYGLTEASPVVAVSPADKPKMGTVGPPLPGVEVRIENPNEEGIGEIIVKGPNVMKEYYKYPEESSRVIKGGWLYTGDLGRIDRDGYITVVGRKKSVIVTAGGKNIYPDEIEACISRSPFILECAVVAVKDRKGNENVAAIVVPDYDALSSKEKLKDNLTDETVREILSIEIKRLCGHLPDYKRIKKFQVRNEGLPRTTTNKLKRHLIQWIEE